MKLILAFALAVGVAAAGDLELDPALYTQSDFLCTTGVLNLAPQFFADLYAPGASTPGEWIVPTIPTPPPSDYIPDWYPPAPPVTVVISDPPDVPPVTLVNDPPAAEAPESGAGLTALAGLALLAALRRFGGLPL